MELSGLITPYVDASLWVIEEIKRLEDELSQLKIASRAVVATAGDLAGAVNSLNALLDED